MTTNPPDKIQNGAAVEADPALDVDLTTLDTTLDAPPAAATTGPGTGPDAGPITYLETAPPALAPAPAPRLTPPAWLTAPPSGSDEPPPPPPSKIDIRQGGDDPGDEPDEAEPLPGLDPRTAGIAVAVIVLLALAYATAGAIATAFPPLASWAGLAALAAYTAAVCTLGMRMWQYRPVLTTWPGMAAVLTVCVGASLLVAAGAVHGVIALLS